MEDSKYYTLQEIEKLKREILAYKDTLMTLKMGTSIEDYQVMKSEFDVLKKQISYIEDLNETMDEKQHTQNEVYEEQVEQFSFQLAALNQTVEEMNQEILSILNKLTFSKGEKISENNTATIQEETHVNKSTIIVTHSNEITPINNQSSIVSNQPSYMQLRNLASQVIQPQKNQKNIAPVEHTEYKENQKQQRHFNLRYFQSINTHPNNIYNGLYKNTTDKESLHFKNTTENPDIPINDFGNSHHSSHITNEPEKTNVSSSINSVPENVNTASLNPIEPNSESVTVSTTSESTYIEPVMPIEKIKKHAESSDVESKKQKNSLLFNIFRKWN